MLHPDLNLSSGLNANQPVTTIRRAHELLKQQQQEIFMSTDRWFAYLMVAQWLFAIVLSLWVTPRTWAGLVSQTHPHVWSALFLGGAITIFPVWLAITRPGEAVVRYAMATAQMLMGGLLIHLTGGRIETHFHVFGSLAFLACYRDWRVLIPAVVVVYIDHYVRGVYWPYSVFGVATSSPWRVLEHGGWVIFECAFLVASIIRSIREMEFIAYRTAELETTNQVIEDKVVERTSALKASEKELERSLSLLQATLESTADGILVVDSDGKIAGFNHKFVELWRIPEGVIKTHDDQQALISVLDQLEDPDAFLSKVQELYNHPEAESHDTLSFKDGRVFERYSQAQFIAGQSAGRVWSFRDISQQKKAELALQKANEELELRVSERTEALEASNREMQIAKQEADKANHAKSEFLSRMSHELRTPLNAILGFSQILEKEDLTEFQKDSISYVLKGGRHLLDLINEVLDIARVEAGRIGLSVEPISLASVVSEASALVRPLADQRNIQLIEDFATLNDAYALADCQRLKQVIINLLSNGIKYNHVGGQVGISCQTNSKGKIRLEVRDTGPGIAPEDIEKLFTPFERLSAAYSEVEGSGLGLALSQRLVTAMGGTLSVESTLGHGSTFVIELPLAKAPEDALADSDVGSYDLDADEQMEGSYTILCIEDNISNLRLLQAILKDRTEITLVAAMQGSIGVELACQHTPDLILLDMNLPDTSGKEVLTRLQQIDATSDIPVVVVSADATPTQIERLLNAGARAYLTKPLDVGQFLRTLDEFLPAEKTMAA
jgi:signal transduction histidine kinase/ActR/RegA family two-component response regulator